MRADAEGARKDEPVAAVVVHSLHLALDQSEAVWFSQLGPKYHTPRASQPPRGGEWQRS
ncbi:hypothetical protein AGR13a_Lc90461 [Agrobacterium genomosp. 13 str. CFBP 6927]|uniref:Uncharacterized protein n=1 Tax=Agrobacterium genomosp. 13 str. CFBP 6927 TaxID=1183428 RepID=A0ABM9VQK6_9HYPH|nr:hypothetical protein AGR13a_Lc90461 [Agrobacterium genomosp. 13 str. CFBP 6927]